MKRHLCVSHSFSSVATSQESTCSEQFEVGIRVLLYSDEASQGRLSKPYGALGPSVRRHCCDMSEITLCGTNAFMGMPFAGGYCAARADSPQPLQTTPSAERANLPQPAGARQEDGGHIGGSSQRLPLRCQEGAQRGPQVGPAADFDILTRLSIESSAELTRCCLVDQLPAL